MNVDLGTIYKEQEKLKLATTRQEERKNILRERDELTKSEMWIEAKSEELADTIKKDISQDRLKPEYRIDYHPHDPFAQLYIDKVNERFRNHGFRGYRVDRLSDSNNQRPAVHVKLYGKL